MLALYPIVLFYLVIGWIVWTSSTPLPAHVVCHGPNCPLARYPGTGMYNSGGMHSDINGGGANPVGAAHVGTLGNGGYGRDAAMGGAVEGAAENEGVGEHSGVQMQEDRSGYPDNEAAEGDAEGN